MFVHVPVFVLNSLELLWSLAYLYFKFISNETDLDFDIVHGTHSRYRNFSMMKLYKAMDVVGVDNAEDYLVTEISKTKRTLKDLLSALETQQQFLRLIVQKMEIKTETDDVDEGVSTSDTPGQGSAHKWTSPKIKKKLGSVLNFNKSI